MLYKAFTNDVDAVDGDFDLDAPGRSSSPSASGKQKTQPGFPRVPSFGNGLFQFRSKKEYKHIDYRWVMNFFRFFWLQKDLMVLFQAEELFKDYRPGILEHGMKMRLALKIIELSVKRNDKILLFR